MPVAVRRILTGCVLAGAALVLQACADGQAAVDTLPVTDDGVEVRIAAAGAVLQRCLEVADSEEARNVGLSGRDAAEIGDGMLFRFETSAVRPFWMRDTRVPLLLAPVASDGRIAEVIPMQPCPPADSASGRCRLYAPSQPYAQAIELPTASLSATDAAAVVPGATAEVGAACVPRR
jgi:uncharacterized membrane protein (UPF0127 family)